MSPTHTIAGGLAAAGTVLAAEAAGVLSVDPTELLASVAIGLLAGELADLDTNQSRVSNGGSIYLSVPGLRQLASVVTAPAVLIGRLLRSPLAAGGVKHRGPTHSLLFAALWTLLAAPLYLACFLGLTYAVAWVTQTVSPAFDVNGGGLELASVRVWAREHFASVLPIVTLSVGAGYLSHLLLDSLTNVPVPWLWPAKRRFSLLPESLQITTDTIAEKVLVRAPLLIALCAVLFLAAGKPLWTQASSSPAAQQTRTLTGKARTTYCRTWRRHERERRSEGRKHRNTPRVCRRS